MDYLINCLILEPLTQIFLFVYLLFYKLTSHYGISIILLSVFTSVLLVPLNRKIRETVQVEKKIENILKPQLKEISESYKGAQRNLAIKRLYSRYSYSPLYSVRSILGVLIQLPFMVGAYLMLKNNTSLNEVVFLGISDLGRPDGLLGFNLLPAVMLGVNIATAYFSSWFSFREKITSVVIGFVFFLILYSAPACMLIYWTGNNIIQLLETLYKRIYVLRQLQDKVKDKFSKTITELSSKRNEGRNLRKNILIFYVRNREICFFVGLVLLSIVWAVIHYAFKLDMFCSMHTDDANCTGAFVLKIFRRISFNRVSVVMTLILAVFLFMIVKRTIIDYLSRNTPRKLLHSDVPVIYALLIAGVLLILISNTFKFHKSNGAVDIILVGVLFCLVYVRKAKSIMQTLNLSSDVRRKARKLFFPSVLVITGLIAVYSPINLYFSAVDDLGLNYYQLLEILIPFYVVLFSVCLFVYAVSTYKLREWLGLGSVFFSIIALLYAMMFVPKFGSLMDFIFISADLMGTPRVLLFQDIAIILSTFVLLYLLFKFRKLRFISTLLYVFAFYIYAYPAYLTVRNNNSLNSRAHSQVDNREEQIQNIKKAVTFSKKENILVIILDAFTGGNIRELVQIHPELLTDLDGFTWYEDTMTLGQHTSAGAQSIISGDNVDPIKFQDDIGVPLANRISQGWSQFINYLTDKKFDVTIQHSVWLMPNILNEYLSNKDKTLFLPEHFGPVWRPTMANPHLVKELAKDDTDLEQDNDFRVAGFLRTYGFYTIMPNSRKYLAYNGGNWRGTGGAGSQSFDWANLKLLEKMPIVGDDKAPQYKLFHFITTHAPYFMNSSCKLIKEDLSTRNNADGTNVGHLNTEYCSLTILTNLFKWMKANNVYDNTQIYITSDHADHSLVDDSRLRANNIQSIKAPIGNASYALLLAKPKNSNGPMKTNSDYLMKTSDIALLIRHSLGDELDKEPYKNKKRVRINVQHDWGQTGNTQNLIGGFVVRGSMFNKDNWTVVSDKNEILNLKTLLTD